MGINISKQTDFACNAYLERFAGRLHIPADDETFWNVLLSYNINLPENGQDQLHLESRLDGLFQAFVNNNLKTGNYGSLIRIFMEKASLLLSLSDQER